MIYMVYLSELWNISGPNVPPSPPTVAWLAQWKHWACDIHLEGLKREGEGRGWAAFAELNIWLVAFATPLHVHQQDMDRVVLSGSTPDGLGLSFPQLVDALARCGLVGFLPRP